MMNKPLSKKQLFYISLIIIAVLITIAVSSIISTSNNQSSNTAVPTNTNTSTVPNSQQSEIDALKREVENLKQRPYQVTTKEVLGGAQQSNISYKYVIANTPMWSPDSETPVGTATKGTKVTFVSKDSSFSTVKIEGLVGDVLIMNDFLADSLSSNTDASDIVQKWKPFTVYIQCDFKDSNGRTYLSSGSGTDYDGTVITNRHVVSDANGYGPSSCSLKFPGSSHVFVEPNSSISVAQNGDDWAVITVSDKKTYINNKPPQGMYGCSLTPTEGDEVLILGYPGIGSQTDITVTRGIISGKDGNYYITDAKIDLGNSGGTAILIKGDCYLGIPTFVIKGVLESLGRILDIKTVPIVGRG